MGTWIVGTVILVSVGFAVRNAYKGYKSGKCCGCGVSCAKCQKNELI